MEEKNKRSITYQEFVEGYKKGIFTVGVRKNMAGKFVLSKFADKHNKPAYLFWHWFGIILLIPVPIALIFIDWRYMIISFIGGLIINKANQKSAVDFVVQNMLDDQSFCGYVLLQGGTKINDKEDNEYLTYK